MISADSRLAALSSRSPATPGTDAPPASAGPSAKNRFQQLLNEGRDKETPAAAKARTTDARPAKEARGSQTASDASLAAAAQAPTEAQTTRESSEPEETAGEATPWPPLGLSAIVLSAPTPAPVIDAVVTTDASAPPATITAAAGQAPPQPMLALNATPTTAATAAVTGASVEGDQGEGEPALTDVTALPSSDTDGANDANVDPTEPMATSLQGLTSFLAGRAAEPAAATSRVLDALPPATPGAPGFDDAIGVRVGWMAEQKIGHAHIRLNPDALGTIDVHLQMDGDKVQASFSSPHVDVRHALESSLPRLRELLGEQGFQLAHADVGQQSPQGERGQASSQLADTGNNGSGERVTESASAPIVYRRGLLDAYA